MAAKQKYECLSAALARKISHSPFPGRDRLSPREMEVLLHLIDGASPDETSARLGISAQTARNHRHRLMRKIGVHNPARIVLLCLLPLIPD